MDGKCSIRKNRVKNTANNFEDATRQLQNHLKEIREQQDRLRQIITNLGGISTKQKSELPLSSPPKSLLSTMNNTMTFAAEHELKEAI